MSTQRERLQLELHRKNDDNITNNLRELILQDMITLHRVDWRRTETIATLKDIAERSVENKKNKDKELKREKEIDAIRMQPFIQHIQSGMRADLQRLQRKEPQWKRLYASIAQLQATCTAAVLDPKLIKDDKKHLELLTNTMTGVQDPNVRQALVLADTTLLTLFNARCKILQQQVDVAKKTTNSAKTCRIVQAALRQALHAKGADHHTFDQLLAQAHEYVAQVKPGLSGKNATLAPKRATPTAEEKTKRKDSYQKLKKMAGQSKDTIKVRSFRHALSRQSGGGDAAPTGMVSEWTYDASTDTYVYPQGHSGTGTLKGLTLGAIECNGMARCVVEQGGKSGKSGKSGGGSGGNQDAVYQTGGKTTTAFVGRARRTNEEKAQDSGSTSSLPPQYSKECGLQWKFQLDKSSNNSATIASLRVRACSSTVGKEKIMWSIKGGTDDMGGGGGDGGGLTSTSTDVPKPLAAKLGYSSYVDFSKHVVGWTWFVIEAKIMPSLEKDTHVEDVQLFRSTTGGGGKKNRPQFSVQMGLSLCNEEAGNGGGGGNAPTKQEMELVLKECELNKVGQLGQEAKMLMEQVREKMATNSGGGGESGDGGGTSQEA